MKKNCIFDLGQVLIPFVAKDIVADFIDDPEEIREIAAVLFDRLYWDRLDLGTIEDDELIEAACARLPEAWRADAVFIYANWFQSRPVIAGMPRLLDDLKARGQKLYLLSNVSCGFAEHYRETPHLAELLGRFDGLAFSGPLHMIKPSPEIYRYLLDTYSLDPADCLFVDDNPKNIAGAEKLGIEGYQFDGDVEKLRAFLGLGPANA